MRQIVFSGLFFLCLCVVDDSCSPADFILEEEFHKEDYLKAFDMSERFSGGYSMCESDSALYFSHYGMSSEYIWYYDKKTGKVGKLCGKPECTHETAQCNAYSIIAGNLNLYDGKLYWTGSYEQKGTYLQCMDLDGNNRRVLKTYPDANGLNIVFRLHRGYLYCGRIIHEVVGGKASARVLLTQEEIENPKDEDRIIVFENNYSGDSTPQIQYVLSGNTLYLAVSGQDQSENYSLEFYTYDTAARTLKCIEEQKESKYSLLDLQMDKSGIYLVERTVISGKYDILIKRYDPSSEVLTVYDEQPQQSPLMYHKVNGYTLNYSRGFEELPQYTVMKEDGTVWRKGKLKPPVTDFRFCNIAYWGWTDDFLIFDMEYYKLNEDGSVNVAFELIAVPFNPAASEKTLWHYDDVYQNSST